MIHRQYVVKLSSDGQGGYPDLDIVVSLPGTPIAPVGLQAAYLAGPPLTVPPINWVAGGANWYYEIRGRAIRVPNAVGSVASIPRLRLGSYLDIVRLMDSTNGALVGTLPGVALSTSLALDPITNPLLGNEIGIFADPAYGPVIRLRNGAALYVGEMVGAYFLVSLGLAENKNEDWTNLGHA